MEIRTILFYVLIVFALYAGYCFRRHNEIETRKVQAAQRKALEEEERFYETYKKR